MPWVTSKQLNELKTASDTLLKELEVLRKRAYLVGIERAQRNNIFTFSRDGKIFQIETLSLWSDSAQKWKKDLLE